MDLTREIAIPYTHHLIVDSFCTLLVTRRSRHTTSYSANGLCSNWFTRAIRTDDTNCGPPELSRAPRTLGPELESQISLYYSVGSVVGKLVGKSSERVGKRGGVDGWVGGGEGTGVAVAGWLAGWAAWRSENGQQHSTSLPSLAESRYLNAVNDGSPVPPLRQPTTPLNLSTTLENRWHVGGMWVALYLGARAEDEDLTKLVRVRQQGVDLAEALRRTVKVVDAEQPVAHANAACR